MGPLNIVMAVPVAGISLHKAHPTFHQATGQQALARKGIRVRVPDPVHLPGRFSLSLKVKDPRDLGLHPVGQFVGGHPGLEVTGLRPRLLVLRVEPGEEIKIGEAGFRISDFVIKDSGLQFQPAELAPKIFISKSFLDETNLLLIGNTAFRNLLIRLPPGNDQAKVEYALSQAISSPEVRIYTHQKAGHRAGRLLRYLSDFLSLVSLVALFLATLGSGYLFHSFLTKRTIDVAILVSLGATRKKATLTYLVQLGFLGIIAALPALLATFLFLPILPIVSPHQPGFFSFLFNFSPAKVSQP